MGDAHATISAVGNDYILEDLRGGPGIAVNGTPTPRRILQHNDVIELGAFHLRYVDSKASSEIDLERTMLDPGPQAQPRPASSTEARPRRTCTSRRRARARRTFRRDVSAGARDRTAGETRLLDRVVATFGTPGQGVVVVTRRPQGYYVTHVEGHSYPKVNGESIGREPRHLHSGDVVEVAGEALEFEQLLAARKTATSRARARPPRSP